MVKMNHNILQSKKFWNDKYPYKKIASLINYVKYEKIIKSKWYLLIIIIKIIPKINYKILLMNNKEIDFFTNN